MIKILITSGGTSEPIDAVRSISNESTGRLGAKIADASTEAGFEVFYLHTPNAVMPNLPVHSIKIKTVNELNNEVVNLLKFHHFDAIIHAMAISDFIVEHVLDYDSIQNSRSIMNLKSTVNRNEKISSAQPVFIQLSPAPKIIKLFKENQPDTILIGFKLLAHSNEDQLIQAAQKQIKDSKSDFVLCNHKEQVFQEAHQAFLYSEQGIIERYDNKTDIANGLVKLIKKEISK